MLANFHELSTEELAGVVRMNQLFCVMHSIHGIGNVCKDSLKDFEASAAPEITTHGFQKATARSYNILWEISKALTYGHGYEKAGVVYYFEPYLNERGIQNRLVSFRGERINILFVIAADAYYHCNHILYFLDYHCITQNKLLAASTDVQQTIFQACFRALGIMGKLITSPLLRLVEEPTTHIFSLNDTWLHVIQKLEEFSTNAEPLLEGAVIALNGKVTKDETCDELLKDTMDSELDDLTEECL